MGLINKKESMAIDVNKLQTKFKESVDPTELLNMYLMEMYDSFPKSLVMIYTTEGLAFTHRSAKEKEFCERFEQYLKVLPTEWSSDLVSDEFEGRKYFGQLNKHSEVYVFDQKILDLPDFKVLTTIVDRSLGRSFKIVNRIGHLLEQGSDDGLV